jgi:hypothetical protein
MNEYEERRRHHRPHSVFGPLFLIAVGVFLFLNALHMISLSGWDLAWRLWPLLFIIGGLDGLYRREGFVGPLVSIGVGSVILAGNLGYLSPGTWTLLIRFWPVFLIALGLDLLIGRRSLVSAIVGIAVGLAMIAAIAWVAMTFTGPRTDLRTEAIHQPLNAAKEVDVRLDAIVGSLNLSGGAESNNLLEGKLKLTGSEHVNADYSVNDGRGSYNLKLDNGIYVYPFTPVPDQDTWSLKLTPSVPVHLDTNVVFGQQTLDLTGTKVLDLKADTVFGRTVVVLPAEGSLEGQAAAVFGEVVLRVPRNANVTIKADTFLTAADMPAGFVRDGDTIYSPNADRSGEASFKVDVPFGSVRIEYQ